ncbi:AAA family ATPase [Photobacterium japonica]|uniref:AAA family ATPase n=1 Tax=Photobacterium japonica TaxID=2910235 RepID=UPI003D12E08B
MKKWLACLAHDAEPDIDECVSVLGRHIAWLHELKSTPQDPEWHAEGNVHIHTGMVLDAVYTLLKTEALHIQGEQRMALILGALLHDIAKPVQTKQAEINGVVRVVSPKHEELGRSYLAFKLMALPLPFSVVWAVLGLVGEHHMPKRLAVKNADRGEYLALSRRVDTELLYWLEVADMKGRVCPDLPLQLQHLDEFRLFAQEYGVWGKAYQPTAIHVLLGNESDKASRYVAAQALSDMQANTIVQEEEALARSFSHKDHYAHLVILCGPSGSGKSTFVSEHFSHYELISLDALRGEINGDQSSQECVGKVLHLAKDKLKACLRSKQHVVWDATNLRRDFRKIIADFGRDYHALVTMVVFLHSEKMLYRSNANRARRVPDEVLKKQLSSYQFPLVDEAHEYIVVGEKGAVLKSLSGNQSHSLL